jgi:hypothetical protein
MAYIPFNCILFDRMIAAFRTPANSGFLIYIADSFGYMASVGVLLYKNFGQAKLSWFNFFVYSSYILAIGGGVMAIISIIYFKRKLQESMAPQQAPMLSQEA